ncbi:MAG: hypothetical protein ACOVNT_06095 [Flavobacterium macrobrachii]
MSRNFFYFLFFIFYNNICISQKILILDINSKTPISFANFSLYQDDVFVKGSYCSDNGELFIPDGLLFNRINISCIGYENLNIYKKNILNDTLLLTPVVYPLKEVVVNFNKKNEFINLGYIKSKRKSFLGASKGRKICTFIDNPFGKIKLVHSFLFKIRNHNKNTKVGFKLHLFEKDTLTNTPGKELLQQDIIIILEDNDKKIKEQDVSNYNIEFPANGAFVGIEWLGILNEYDSSFKGIDTQNGSIELNDDSKEFSTFERDRFSFYPWENLEKFKKISEEHTNFRNCPTASFGLKLYKD